MFSEKNLAETWLSPVILAPERLRQETHEFTASVDCKEELVFFKINK